MTPGLRLWPPRGKSGSANEASSRRRREVGVIPGRALRANPESRSFIYCWIPGLRPKRAHPGMTADQNNPRGKGMANKVKEIWASGKAVVNAWLAIPSGFSAEVIAQCG